MTQVILSSASSSKLTTEEIQELRRRHIAEISKHLATEPIQSDDLEYEASNNGLISGWQDLFPNHTDLISRSRFRTSG